MWTASNDGKRKPHKPTRLAPGCIWHFVFRKAIRSLRPAQRAIVTLPQVTNYRRVVLSALSSKAPSPCQLRLSRQRTSVMPMHPSAGPLLDSSRCEARLRSLRCLPHAAWPNKSALPDNFWTIAVGPAGRRRYDDATVIWHIHRCCQGRSRRVAVWLLAASLIIEG